MKKKAGRLTKSRRTIHPKNGIIPLLTFAHFLTNFYFSPNDSPSKTIKIVFYFI